MKQRILLDLATSYRSHTLSRMLRTLSVRAIAALVALTRYADAKAQARVLNKMAAEGLIERLATALAQARTRLLTPTHENEYGYVAELAPHKEATVRQRCVVLGTEGGLHPHTLAPGACDMNAACPGHHGGGGNVSSSEEEAEAGKGGVHHCCAGERVPPCSHAHAHAHHKHGAEGTQTRALRQVALCLDVLELITRPNLLPVVSTDEESPRSRAASGQVVRATVWASHESAVRSIVRTLLSMLCGPAHVRCGGRECNDNVRSCCAKEEDNKGQGGDSLDSSSACAACVHASSSSLAASTMQSSLHDDGRPMCRRLPISLIPAATRTHAVECICQLALYSGVLYDMVVSCLNEALGLDKRISWSEEARPLYKLSTCDAHGADGEGGNTANHTIHDTQEERHGRSSSSSSWACEICASSASRSASHVSAHTWSTTLPLDAVSVRPSRATCDEAAAHTLSPPTRPERTEWSSTETDPPLLSCAYSKSSASASSTCAHTPVRRVADMPSLLSLMLHLLSSTTHAQAHPQSVRTWLTWLSHVLTKENAEDGVCESCPRRHHHNTSHGQVSCMCCTTPETVTTPVCRRSCDGTRSRDGAATKHHCTPPLTRAHMRRLVPYFRFACRLLREAGGWHDGAETLLCRLVALAQRVVHQHERVASMRRRGGTVVYGQALSLIRTVIALPPAPPSSPARFAAVSHISPTHGYHVGGSGSGTEEEEEGEGRGALEEWAASSLFDSPLSCTVSPSRPSMQEVVTVWLSPQGAPNVCEEEGVLRESREGGDVAMARVPPCKRMDTPDSCHSPVWYAAHSPEAEKEKENEEARVSSDAGAGAGRGEAAAMAGVLSTPPQLCQPHPVEAAEAADGTLWAMRDEEEEKSGDDGVDGSSPGEVTRPWQRRLSLCAFLFPGSRSSGESSTNT